MKVYPLYVLIIGISIFIQNCSSGKKIPEPGNRNHCVKNKNLELLNEFWNISSKIPRSIKESNSKKFKYSIKPFFADENPQSQKNTCEGIFLFYRINLEGRREDHLQICLPFLLIGEQIYIAGRDTIEESLIRNSIPPNLGSGYENNLSELINVFESGIYYIDYDGVFDP